jgi:hypothetical protein
MGRWIKANGGPLAIAVLGLAFLWADHKTVGWALIVVGVLGELGSRQFVRRRIPYTLVRKDAIAALEKN